MKIIVFNKGCVWQVNKTGFEITWEINPNGNEKCTHEFSNLWHFGADGKDNGPCMTVLPHSHPWYSYSVRAVGPFILQKKCFATERLPLNQRSPDLEVRSWLLVLILNSGLFFRANKASLYGLLQLCEQDIFLSYCMASPASALEIGEGRNYLHIFSLWVGWLHDFGGRFWGWTRMTHDRY